MAIQVNQYQQIRMYYEQEHRSIRWIARELHCSRDTVRKYITGDSVPWDRKPGSGRKHFFIVHVPDDMELTFCENCPEYHLRGSGPVHRCVLSRR